MQCFICVIYLIIYCNAQIAKYRELSMTADNLTLPGKNSTNLPDRIDNVPPMKDELEVSLNSNGSKIKISDGELESTSESDVVDEELQSDQTTKLPESNKQEPSELINNVINKEYIKFMMAGASGNDPSYRPILNAMEDMSQIGDSDRLTIINPTVIVNFRGTIFNRDTDLNLGQRKKDKKKPRNSSETQSN